MPEHLALWALKHFGPRAASSVAGARQRDPANVIARQTRVTVAEGALVGGPFIVLIPVAWCAALLAQAQMVFELAALAGHSPTDEMRAVDLLVLQGAYSTSADAGAALARVTNELPGKRLPRGTRIALIRRMAYMLGLIGAGDAKPNVLRSILGWIFVGVVFVVGFVLPFVWIPYMAVWMRKSTLQLGERATAFYATEAGADAGVTVRKAQSVRAGLAGGFLRMALLLCAPVGIAVVAFASGGPVAAGIVVFLAVAFLLTSVWIGFRWWRRRRQVDSQGT
ncbi:MAG: hypothetical protein AUG91_06650 [Actinobacteria bacterium 13_1_20CM_4_69_9]|nr:MAG: hypothetical protein AUG91_06650 [Actinobacteria bacterium 13_1_20CM_4_69_9]